MIKINDIIIFTMLNIYWLELRIWHNIMRKTSYNLWWLLSSQCILVPRCIHVMEKKTWLIRRGHRPLLRGPLLMLTSLFLVLSALGRGQHGQPAVWLQKHYVFTHLYQNLNYWNFSGTFSLTLDQTMGIILPSLPALMICIHFNSRNQHLNK